MGWVRAIVFAGVAALWGVAAPALDFTLGVGPLRDCQGRGPGVRIAAMTFLEPAPVLSVDDYGGRRYHPSDGDNVAVGVGYADLTAPAGRYCVGVFYRTDYRGSASRDTLDALVANHRREPFAVGREYDLDFGSTYLDSLGLRVSRVVGFQPADRWLVQLGVTGSIMRALTNREAELKGSAIATSGRYAVGTATLVRTETDYDSRDFNPFVGTGEPRGYGYSFDAGFEVRYRDRYVATATVMDAYSHVQWDDVPRSVENADNATIRYDANFNREALVQGRDRRVRVSQDIGPRYRLALSAPIAGPWSAFAADDYVYRTHFPSVGVGYSWTSSYAEVEFDFETNAVSAMIGRSWLRLSVSTDDLNPADASVLGVGLSVAAAW